MPACLLQPLAASAQPGLQSVCTLLLAPQLEIQRCSSAPACPVLAATPCTLLHDGRASNDARLRQRARPPPRCFQFGRRIFSPQLACYATGFAAWTVKTLTALEFLPPCLQMATCTTLLSCTTAGPACAAAAMLQGRLRRGSAARAAARLVPARPGSIRRRRSSRRSSRRCCTPAAEAQPAWRMREPARLPPVQR